MWEIIQDAEGRNLWEQKTFWGVLLLGLGLAGEAFGWAGAFGAVSEMAAVWDMPVLILGLADRLYKALKKR